MDAIYILVNEDDFLIRQKITYLHQKNKNYELIKYDLKTSSIDEVIEDLDTYHLLASHKLVIASNCTFLTSESTKDEKLNLFKLERYLEQPNLENTLVLCCSKLDERKKIVKQVLKVSTRPSLEINLKKIIKERLEDYTMSDSDITFLIEYCRGQNEKILSELDKLKLYCYEQKKILTEDIILNVTRSIDDDIFHLVDMIVAKNKKEAFTIYQELLSHNEEPIKILILVANQFRLLYQIKVLKNEYKKEDEIAKMIGVHPYRVKLALQKIRDFQESELLSYLSMMAILDEDIKMGKTFQNVAFEMFLLNL